MSISPPARIQSHAGSTAADDLPRFEGRFKELLNENTIREVANFQSQLARERETIKERIARINESLTQIDYNPGRYISLEAQMSPTPTSVTSRPSCAPAPKGRSPGRRMRSIRRPNSCR
jgi:uncharacterized protein YPO0396